MNNLIPDISENIKKIRGQKPVNREIYKNDALISKNEFLFFIKPEITLNDASVKLDAILSLIFEKIELFNMDVKNIRIINASYLEKHNIIAQHYGVINKLSKKLKEYITQEAKENFYNLFGEDFEKVEVLGSLEFLDKYPEFTPTGLSYLWQNAPTEKLAGGTYAQKLSLDGKSVYLINGFHPRQLEHFIAEDRIIVTMTLVSDTDWAVARNSFIGKTNPADAETGSTRNELLKNKNAFGLQSVSSTWNGVHLSAGPVEGLVELMRYNSDYEGGTVQSAKDYVFGRLLIGELDEKKAEKIIKNAVIDYQGKKESIFDLTEEMNADECLQLLKELNF